MHYGTFPALTGTPAKLRELVEPKGVQVLELKPGETALADDDTRRHEGHEDTTNRFSPSCSSCLRVFVMTS